MPRRVCILTYGCQMNKLDSERAMDRLVAAGHAEAEGPEDADTVILNTCAVRRRAEEKVLSRAGQFGPRAARDPNFWLGLMGCFAERRGADLFRDLPRLRLVAGPRQEDQIVRHLADAVHGPVLAVGDPAPGLAADAGGAPDAPDAPRGACRAGVGPQAYVAAMRGCGNRCAYCVVPQVRGGEESRPAAEIVDEVRRLALAGAREVTLLGQNIDAWGRGSGACLADLLEEVTARVPERDGLLRLRFVTSHPRDITPRLARAVAALAPRVCPHFHMPAQSGSDRVLAAMGRGYTRAEYDSRLAMLRECAPGALVASDFIVGFPGETEEDFAATCDLVRRAEFQNCYVFKYSPRPGTRAGDHMPDDVPLAEKRRRNQALLDLQRTVGEARAARLRGTRQTVLVEGVSARDKGRLTGRTGSNLIVVFPAPPSGGAGGLAGRLAEVDITGGTALALVGEMALGPAKPTVQSAERRV